jgi:hypothetical protein
MFLPHQHPTTQNLLMQITQSRLHQQVLACKYIGFNFMVPDVSGMEIG